MISMIHLEFIDCLDDKFRIDDLDDLDDPFRIDDPDDPFSTTGIDGDMYYSTY